MSNPFPDLVFKVDHDYDFTGLEEDFNGWKIQFKYLLEYDHFKLQQMRTLGLNATSNDNGQGIYEYYKFVNYNHLFMN